MTRIWHVSHTNWASLVAQLVKNLPEMQETLVWFLGREDPLERDRLPTPVFWGFPGGSACKDSTYNRGNLDLIPGLERSPEEGNSYTVFWPGKFHRLYIPVSQFSRSVISNSLQPHGLHHARLPCPSPTPGAYSNSCPSSWWCHSTISSSVIPSPAAFNLSQHQGLSQWVSSFQWFSGQSIGVSVSASVLSMNIQDWFPSGLTGWISLQSKGLSRVFSNTTVQKHQFLGAQLSL